MSKFLIGLVYCKFRVYAMKVLAIIIHCAAWKRFPTFLAVSRARVVRLVGPWFCAEIRPAIGLSWCWAPELHNLPSSLARCTVSANPSPGHRWLSACNHTTGVNPAGDAGDTSPQYFGWGGRQLEYPPQILLRTFGYSRPILVALRSLSLKPISFGYKTPPIHFSQAGGQSAHKARPPPNLELTLTPLNHTESQLAVLSNSHNRTAKNHVIL